MGNCSSSHVLNTEVQGQKSRQEILNKVTSDHAAQKFDIEITDSADQKETISIASWNVLQPCRDAARNGEYANNPWNYHETYGMCENRKTTQKDKIKELAHNHGIICLQETHAYRDKESLIKELGRSWRAISTPRGAGRNLITLYDESRYSCENSRLVLDNGEQQRPFFCGLETTLRSKDGSRGLVTVVNAHNVYGEQSKTLVDGYFHELYSHRTPHPTIITGDMNYDASNFQSAYYQTVSCGQATNFDVKQDADGKYSARSDTAHQVTEEKCFDMAHIFLPPDYSAHTIAHGDFFTDSLSLENTAKRFEMTTDYVRERTTSFSDNEAHNIIEKATMQAQRNLDLFDALDTLGLDCRSCSEENGIFNVILKCTQSDLNKLQHMISQPVVSPEHYYSATSAPALSLAPSQCSSLGETQISSAYQHVIDSSMLSTPQNTGPYAQRVEERRQQTEQNPPTGAFLS